MSERDAERDPERDPFVAAALTAIDVPPHRPGFWVDLDHAIDERHPDAALASDDTATIAGPVLAPPVLGAPPVLTVPSAVADSPIELADESAPAAPPRTSRTRFAVRLLGAAAAIAIVIGAGAVLVREDSGSGPDLSAPGPEEPATPDPGVPEDGAADAVLRWVDALGAGDIPAAAALMGAQSSAYAEALDGSVEAHLQTGYTEGYGAWASSSDRTVTVHEIDPGAAIVVLRGTRQVEGMVEDGVAAIPARRAESAGVWFVEPNAFDPDVEDQGLDYVGELPAPGAPVEVAAASPGTMYFWVGASDATAVPTTSGEGGDTATWSVPDTAEAGDLLVIAFVSESGTTFTALARVL
jgi:hypothetical protein